MAVEHYENFPVASWLCPPAIRPAVESIYWFARTADDLADEGEAPAAERLVLLAEYRTALASSLAGRPHASRWPRVYGPLTQAIERFALPGPLLHALLDAFEQDVRNPVYRDRAELLDYCRRSANPIGRLLLHLHGDTDARSTARSDDICTALQLINFWQDLSVDLPRGRCYVPQEDARRHGVEIATLRPGSRPGPAAVSLVRELAEWARTLMMNGAPLAPQLRGRFGWELRGVVQGGLRVLDKIHALGFETWNCRPRLTAADVPLIAWRALRMRARHDA